jgi:hypothetical protein
MINPQVLDLLRLQAASFLIAGHLPRPWLVTSARHLVVAVPALIFPSPFACAISGFANPVTKDSYIGWCVALACLALAHVVRTTLMVSALTDSKVRSPPYSLTFPPVGSSSRQLAKGCSDLSTSRPLLPAKPLSGPRIFYKFYTDATSSPKGNERTSNRKHDLILWRCGESAHPALNLSETSAASSTVVS